MKIMSDAETQGMPVRKGCLAFFVSWEITPAAGGEWRRR